MLKEGRAHAGHREESEEDREEAARCADPSGPSDQPPGGAPPTVAAPEAAVIVAVEDVAVAPVVAVDGTGRPRGRAGGRGGARRRGRRSAAWRRPGAAAAVPAPGDADTSGAGSSRPGWSASSPRSCPRAGDVGGNGRQHRRGGLTLDGAAVAVGPPTRLPWAPDSGRCRTSRTIPAGLASCWMRSLDPSLETWDSSMALVRARAAAFSTSAPMPALSFSSDTCMKTRPMSRTPSRRSSRGCAAGGPASATRGSGRGAGPAGSARDRAGVMRSRAAPGSGALQPARGPVTRRGPRGPKARRVGVRAWPVERAGAVERRRHARSSGRSLRAARSRAEAARGLSAISSALGCTERRDISAASAVRPQAQTGRSGGQMHPRARSARKRFTRRSSREWKEIPANRPFSRSRAQAAGSAWSICSSSPLTAMRIAWKERLAGWPPAKRAERARRP